SPTRDEGAHAPRNDEAAVSLLAPSNRPKVPAPQESHPLRGRYRSPSRVADRHVLVGRSTARAEPAARTGPLVHPPETAEPFESIRADLDHHDPAHARSHPEPDVLRPFSNRWSLSSVLGD